VEARTTWPVDANTFPWPQRQLKFGSQSCTGVSSTEPFMSSPASGTQYRTRVEIIKTGVATALCRVDVDLSYSGGANTGYSYQVDLSALDFTIANNLQFNIFQYIASVTELNSFTVDKIAS